MQGELDRYHDKDYTRSLWLGLLTGPVVWALYHLVAYLVNEVACRAGLMQATLLGIPLLTVVTIVLTLVAMAVVVYAGIWDYRHWRRIDRQGERVVPESVQEQGEAAAAEEEVEGWERSRFMAFAGMLLSLLFALTILLAGIPALVLVPCG